MGEFEGKTIDDLIAYLHAGAFGNLSYDEAMQAIAIIFGEKINELELRIEVLEQSDKEVDKLAAFQKVFNEHTHDVVVGQRGITTVDIESDKGDENDG